VTHFSVVDAGAKEGSGGEDELFIEQAIMGRSLGLRLWAVRELGEGEG